jgi:hypothetical protein
MSFFIAFISGVVLFYSFQYFPFSTVLISMLSSIYLFFQKRFFIICMLLSGIVFAFIRYEPVNNIPYIKDNVAVKGVFESYPIKTDSGMFRQTLKIKSAMNIKDYENNPPSPPFSKGGKGGLSGDIYRL